MSALAVHRGGGARDSARWGISFVVVFALHVGVAAGILYARIPVAPAEAPPDAILIDLEPPPKPVTPVAAPPPPPPEPEPEVKKVEEPPPPPVNPEVVLPKPPPPKPRPPRPQRVEEPPPEPKPIPMAAPVKAAPAPVQTKQVATIDSAAVPTWEAQILARLERFKRYPRRAQLRRQEGVAYLRFTLGRHGDVQAYALQRSSGIDALDEETMSLIERAKPFPPPPPELGRETVELVVPIRYVLR